MPFIRKSLGRSRIFVTIFIVDLIAKRPVRQSVDSLCCLEATPHHVFFFMDVHERGLSLSHNSAKMMTKYIDTLALTVTTSYSIQKKKPTLIWIWRAGLIWELNLAYQYLAILIVFSIYLVWSQILACLRK